MRKIIIPEYLVQKIRSRHLTKTVLLFLLPFLVMLKTKGQVGIGTNNPDSSAALHIQDTTRGILVPSMTANQRMAIKNPAEGLLVYQTDGAPGFWYFTRNVWKDITGANNGGLHTIILSHNITDSEARIKIAEQVGPNTQEIRIEKCTNLTTVDLAGAVNLSEVSILENPVLRSVSFNNVKEIAGGVFINRCPLLQTISANSLENIGSIANETYGVKFWTTGLVNIHFPLLKSVGGIFYVTADDNLETIDLPQLISASVQVTGTSVASISFPAMITGSLSISSNSKLTSLVVPKLESATLTLSSLATITNLSFPSLTSGAVQISQNPKLTSINFPLLEYSGGITVQNNLLLPSFTFPLLRKVGNILVTHNINGIPTLSSISFPALDSSGTITIQNLPVLAYCNFTFLRQSSLIVITANNSINSIAFPNLTTIDAITITDNLLLGSLSLPVLSKVYMYAQAVHFRFNGNRLPSSNINALLNRFASISPPIIYDFFHLRQSVPAPPTGQGLVDKATLLARNNVVETN